MALPRDEDEAIKRVEQALAPWRDLLITTQKGAPKALLANAITAFRAAPEWAGLLRFDAFAQRTMLFGKAPWMNIGENRAWTPTDDILATNWLQHQGIHVGPEIVNTAVETVARDFAFHPVLEYLNALVWDGIPRLNRWAVDCLGVEESAFTYAVSAKFLIQAVARVNRPGCKADSVLILEGPQGIMKSTVLNILFRPWFSDDLADIGSKDSAMQLSGKWCVEMPELDSMKRSDVSKAKAFFSRSHDNFRPPYGRRPIELPRQCCIAGTVNESEYLRDETGNRRIWPLSCGVINVNYLKEIRDQLWAEASARFWQGETWWLDDPTLIKEAKTEQGARRISDPWQPEIERLVRNLDSTTPDELLAELSIPVKDQQQLHRNRIASCLTAIGWRRKIVRTENEGPRRRYFPPNVAT